MTGPIEPGMAWSPALVPPPLHRAGAIAWRVLVVVALLAIVIWLAFVLGTVTASILVALIVGVSAFFYPLWSAWIVPYDFWHAHMWLQTWV